MTHRTRSTVDVVSRRSVLASVSIASVGVLAGCLGDPTDDDEADEPDETSASEKSQALAAEMAAAIDDDLSVENWTLGGMFILEYADSGGVESDVPILGDAYAEIVERGFDHRAMPTALGDRGTVDFMVFLEPDWADTYLEGEWSSEEYHAEILASEH